MTRANLKLALLSLTAFLACSVLALPAMAALYSGFVNGRILTFQGQGQFCNDGPMNDGINNYTTSPGNTWAIRNCTGALFKDEHVNLFTGIPEATMEVRNSSGGIIGTGSSDVNGNFTIWWSTNGSFTSAKVWWYAKHVSGRFKVTSMTSTNPVSYNAGTVNLVHGENVNMGNRNWGTSLNPERYSNVYEGAYRMWANALASDPTMQSLFTNVRIKGFDSTSCPSSCAWTATKEVEMDNSFGTAFTPQPRIMHELGHIASGLADGHKGNWPSNVGRYSWPFQTDTPAVDGWNLTTTEWQSSNFEEGLATFIGDLSIYNYTAIQPHTCAPGVSGGNAQPAAPCPTGTFNTEASSGFQTGGCPVIYSGPNTSWSDSGRWPITVTRYLWDLYDTQEDSAISGWCNGGAGFERFDEEHGNSITRIIGTLKAYAKGINDHQNNEVFSDTGLTTIGQWHGRGAWDFQWNMLNTSPFLFNSANQMCMNCMDPSEAWVQ